MDRVETREIPPAQLRGGGYMAMDHGYAPRPGIVVIHEAHGLNDQIRDVTRRVAQSGYVALAADLFSGRNRAVSMARYMAGALRGSVNRYGIDDLRASLTFLAKQPEVDAGNMGAIAFCMGGVSRSCGLASIRDSR